MIQENSSHWTKDRAQTGNGSELPDTVRLRIRQEQIAAITALKRENIDNIYNYLSGMIDKAKEELAHCRSSSNEHRRALLRQHIDEIVAYLGGHNIGANPPARYDSKNSQFEEGMYVLNEVPTFLGEVRCVIDQWHGQTLSKVHDEVSQIIDFSK